MGAIGRVVEARAHAAEWLEQIKLVHPLTRYLDPALRFWTFLENEPRSMLAGAIQRRRGVKSGLPDLLVCFRRKPTGYTRVVAIELKSHSGIDSKAQKQIREEMLPSGAKWFLVRSARGALTALKRSGAPGNCRGSKGGKVRS